MVYRGDHQELTQKMFVLICKIKVYILYTFRWLAVTQFQPTSARLVFPCYDEPHLKAFFTLTLEHANGLISRSNMPIDKQ